MTWYRLSIILHITAVLLWFGHMFFWSIVVGPIIKRFEPPETGRLLQHLSGRFGGLGWPALCLLILTGIVMLSYRGVTFGDVCSGQLFHSPFGRGLGVKLALVTCMILYQLVVGHKPAPRLIYLNMAAALAILAISVTLVRAPTVFGLH